MAHERSRVNYKTIPEKKLLKYYQKKQELLYGEEYCYYGAKVSKNE